MQALSLLLFSALLGCSSAPSGSALSDPRSRMVFGRLIHRGPPGFATEIGNTIRYTIDGADGPGSQPTVDHRAGYYWATVPISSRRFRVQSITLALNGTVAADPFVSRCGPALASADLPAGGGPVYVGDLVATTGVRDAKAAAGTPFGIGSYAWLKGLRVDTDVEAAGDYLASRDIELADFGVSRLILENQDCGK